LLYINELWFLTLVKKEVEGVKDCCAEEYTFGPKREEITGDWQKLDNSELHNLPSSPNMFESCSLNW